MQCWKNSSFDTFTHIEMKRILVPMQFFCICSWINLSKKYLNSSSTSKASSVQIMCLKWSSLLVLTTILVGSQAYQSLMDLETDSRLLSRQRRFLIPNVTSDWTFTVRFSLAFPLEGLDTTFDGNVPFSMTFNLNR